MTDLAEHVAEHHRSLEDWLRLALPGATVAWGSPDGEDGPGLVVTLDDVRGVTDLRVDRDLPLRLDLTYVLAPTGDPTAVAAALAAIVAAVRNHASYQLDEVPDETWWVASGQPRRPVARLRTRLVVELEPEPEAPPVRERRVEITQPGTVRGTVTRGGQPLGGVEIGLLDRVERTRTDRGGRFVLRGVDRSHPVQVVVASGRSRFTATIPPGVDDPEIVCPEPDPVPAHT